MLQIILCTTSFLGLMMAMEYPSCIEPPKECPNENVTFWLYTRTNQDNPHQLRPDDDDSIKSAPWVQEAPIKILIHGYTGNKDYSPNSEIRPAYMECCDYNVISVDYNPIALEPCYQSAAKNTELVGMCTAQLIDKMVQTFSFDLSRFHVIGFSLGGHAAGQVGKHLRSGRLDRITGLDPALPLFVTRNPKVKLSPSDATFVDVLHTNALERGKVESCGHVDFYANGGLTQPGCYDTIERSKSSCDHARAPAYYAESINTDVGFYGTRCFSWIAYMIGWCELNDPNEEVLYGEYVPLKCWASNLSLFKFQAIHTAARGLFKRLLALSTPASGLYFFSTNSKPPYARGRNKMQTEGSEY